MTETSRLKRISKVAPELHRLLRYIHENRSKCFIPNENNAWDEALEHVMEFIEKGKT